jgi:hypothetical protein
MRVEQGPNNVDMFHCMSRSALECIGRAGLGHSFESDVAYGAAAEEMMYV